MKVSPIETLRHVLLQRGGNSLATAHDMFETRLGFDVGIGQEGLEHGGHKVERGDAVPLDQLDDALWISMVLGVPTVCLHAC